MKLDKVEITYFRCFESLKIPLQPDVNVFVGVNGSGKTAILDAIAIALWDIVAANGGGGKRQRTYNGVDLNVSDIHMPLESFDLVSWRPDFVQVRGLVTDFYEISGFPAKTRDNAPMFIEWQNHIQFRPPRGFDYESSKSA
jgi:hypothetical protein